MADIPATGKPINDFATGSVSSGTLFPAAFPDPNTGFNTGKISAAELGQGMGENIRFPGLRTIGKTIFAAINEIKTIDPSIADVDTITIPAGETTAIKFDTFYDPDATYDIYTDYFRAKLDAIDVIAGPYGAYGIAIGITEAFGWDVQFLVVKRG